MIKKCINCGKEFTADASHKKYCCKKCYEEYKKKKQYQYYESANKKKREKRNIDQVKEKAKKKKPSMILKTMKNYGVNYCEAQKMQTVAMYGHVDINSIMREMESKK